MPCSLAPLLLLPTLQCSCTTHSQSHAPVLCFHFAPARCPGPSSRGCIGQAQGNSARGHGGYRVQGEGMGSGFLLLVRVGRGQHAPPPLVQARTATLENTLVLGRYIKLDLHAGAIKRSAGGGGGGGGSRGRISTAVAGGEGISPAAFFDAGRGAISSGASRGRFLPPFSADSPTPWQQGQAGRWGGQSRQRVNGLTPGQGQAGRWEGQSRQRRVIEGPADGALYLDPRRPDQPDGGPSSSEDSTKVMALEAQDPPSATTKTSAQQGTDIPARMLLSGSGAAAADAEGATGAAAAAGGGAEGAAAAAVAGAAAGSDGVSPASRRQRGGYLRGATTPPDAVGPEEEEGLPLSPSSPTPAAATAAPVRQRGGYLRGGSGRPGGSFAQSRPQDPAA